ncbi:EscU/YscU/HrcU family type III secretion system export apparatus switch protein [Sulfitobacter sp. 20_GPM-1509m]|uniref:EscU/YscU/HrcU family type III secretion system export apparatus switch protein n=1 Tax=Sulfitobacter sp. 20_GPM-1509m TaxID=1380367 RepID=UPI00048EFE24|nr:EscU/YscU/HrcU family type III secretion system export apparatus switch protein [Sulfitobacter sp. 20_GPM-1509m]
MSDTEEKTKPPSEKKLRKQREEGNVAQSQAMTGFATCALGLGVLLAVAPLMLDRIVKLFAAIFRAVPLPLSETRGGIVTLAIEAVVGAVAPLVGATVGAALLITMLFHRGLPFSMKPLTPKFDKLSPASGFKRLVSRRAWTETGIGLVRIVLWFISAAFVVWMLADTLFRLDLCGAPCTAELALTLVWRLLPLAIAMLLVNAGLDMLVQTQLYHHEQKMSVSEFKREQKDSHGAPEIRQARNQIRKESARGAEHAGVERANMCFYSEEGAVGIRFHPDHTPLPRVAATARGPEAAAALRATIRNQDHPEEHNPLITGYCLRSTLGTPVPEAAFAELAQALGRLFG